MNNFRALNQSIIQYREIKKLKLRGEVRSQIERAALSVCLNLTEGNARRSQKDRRRMFNIAYSSQQEVKTLLIILKQKRIYRNADILGAMIYRLQLSIMQNQLFL